MGAHGVYILAGALLCTEQCIGGPLKTLRQGLLQDDLFLVWGGALGLSEFAPEFSPCQDKRQNKDLEGGLN